MKNNQNKKLLIIGGTAAGMSAASNAKRQNPSLKVTILERTGYISYGSCGIPYYIGELVEGPEGLLSFTPESAKVERDIDVITHTEATKIDTSEKKVFAMQADTNEELVFDYDELVIATGASPIALNIPGRELQNIYMVRVVEDGIAIRNAIGKGKKKVVIIGAGMIGLEMAAELAGTGNDVTVLEGLSALLPAFPTQYADMIAKELESHDVKLCLNTMITGYDGDGTKVTRVLADGESFDADIVIESVGVRPNSSIAADAGIATGIKGAIVVDAYMRTNVPGVWACGDCAETRHMQLGHPTYIPLGTTANKMGRTAGLNVAGIKTAFAGVTGSQITKVFDLCIGGTGLNKAQAEQEGFEPAEVSITKRDNASYYPGGTDMHVSLVFDAATGKVLGTQCIGGIPVAGKINAVAVAIAANMTVAELNGVDYVYAPPVASVADPLQIASAQAMKKVRMKN